MAPFVSATGAVSLSVDAVGTNDPAGAVLLVEKPTGATVRNAYLMAASTGFTGYEPQNGDISIGGTAVDWDPSRTMMNGISSVNVWADVTSLVKPAVDGAAPGSVSFLIEEGAVTTMIDGAILAVIFDDPNVQLASVILSYGAQQVTGDRIRLVRPDDVSSSDVEVNLGVGISFGNQPTDQDNTIDVNGVRLTSSAGGQDDGQKDNGALITVGGLGDAPDNPPDPFARGDQPTCPRCDDELYDLKPFLSTGSVSELVLTTANPSADDNFFFAALEVAGATATWTPNLDRNPLVVLPGITGSFLEDANGSEIWPDEGRTARDTNDDHLDVLALAANGVDPADPANQISVSTSRGADGLILETELCSPIFCQHLADVYKPMLNTLADDHGYVMGVDLFPFAFDWRLSAEANGQLLLDLIEQVRSQTGTAKVNIAAHSQGGLVTRAALDDARSVCMVERVTTWGTPNLGATKLHGVLDLQEPCQADAPVGCFLARAKAQELATNWPGALELLPSRAFFDAYTSSIRREIDDDGNGVVEGLLAFDDVRAQLADRNLNLVDQATGFHARLDEWDPADSTVDLLRMVGIDTNTILRIRQFLEERCSGILWWRNCELVETFEFEMGDGDGTVPRRSASLLGGGLDISGGAKVCNVWGKDTGHSNLPNNELVLAITLDFLEDDDFRCEARPGLATAQSSDLTAAAATIDTSITNAGEAGVDLIATELVVRGMATGFVERVGSGGQDILGIIDDGTGPVEIEGVDGGSYTEGPSSASFAFTDNQQYLGSWTATGDGQISFVLRGYDAAIASVSSTGPIDVEAGAALHLAFSHPLDPSSVVVEIDDDGDGSPDRSAPFAPQVTGPEAADAIAPVSTVTVRPIRKRHIDSLSAADRQHRKRGTKLVEVTITASDEGGSGVEQIEYALDATGESFVYDRPFIVPALGELYMRAHDRAGNIEAPHQVVVLDDHPSRIDLVDEFHRVRFRRSGVLGYDGDVDNVGVAITKAGRYRFKLTGEKVDYKLRLLAEDGSEIAVSDRRRSELIVVELDAGRYYLEVTGVGRDHHRKPRYWLSASSEEAPRKVDMT